MTAAGPSGPPPRWRRLLTRRRHRMLLAVVLVLLAVRIALPSIIRRVVVSQADAALVGRIEIDDVDLSLLTGGFTLHGLRVFSDEAAGAAKPGATKPGAAKPGAATPGEAKSIAANSTDAKPDDPAPIVASPTTPQSAGEGAPGTAPVFSAKRLSVDLGFLAFLRKIVEVQRIELEDVAVSLDRARDGRLVLPAVTPSAEPEPSETEGPGWGVLIQSVALRGGRIGFRDFAVGDPPQHVDVTLPSLDAGQLALLITESGAQPGKVSLDAEIQDGTLHLDATLESLPAGPAYESHVVLTNVPIADSRLYIPKVGWSGLTGRLDADLVHRFESHGAHTVRGTVAMRDLGVRVAGLDEPALAWRSLAVDVANLDLVAQHADVTRLALDGARVVTRPAGPEPLPVLHVLAAAAADADIVHRASPAASPTPATSATGSAPEATATPPPPSATVHAESAKPWTWAVGTVLVTDGNVRAVGGDAPLDVAVAATLAPLASGNDTHTNVALTLTPAPGGSIELAGDVTLTPLAFDGTLAVKDLALAPLTQPVATTTTRLLKHGIASLELAIFAGATPKAPPDGVSVSGTVALTDIDIAGEDAATFAVRWQRLDAALRSLTAPGVLAPGGASAPGPIDAAFASIALQRAELTVTRTAAGIALPAAVAGAAPAPSGATAAAPSGATAAAPPAASTAAPSGARAAAPPEVHVRADRVAIEKMRLVSTDTAVKPFFHSTLDPIDLSCTDVAWPGPSAKDLKLVANSADGAVLTVTGTVAPARSRLVAKLAGLPLAPFFNSYAAGSGYGVGGGTAQLDSTITMSAGKYDTKSRLVLNRLDVRGGEGDTLFTSRFGMPLALALSLLTDLQGNIVIDLPISGDEQGMRAGVGTVIGNALARAILNAVTSPLKLIGAVARIGEKPESVMPQPIAFLAGRDTLADGEDAKLAPLASLLAKAPGLRLHLRGEAGDQDRRWLREQALRAKLEKERGVVGTLRHIGERGPRVAVLAVLTERAAGRPAEIPTEHQDWFEQQVAAQTVDADALAALAAARASSLRTKLGSNQGVDAERVTLDEPITDASARSVVAVGLGSPAPPARQ